MGGLRQSWDRLRWCCLRWLLWGEYQRAHKERGYGECEQTARCGAWCYVNDGNSCSYSYRSYIGSPYRWTCEACPSSRVARLQTDDTKADELVVPPCPHAYSASSLTISSVIVVLLSVLAALSL